MVPVTIWLIQECGKSRNATDAGAILKKACRASLDGGRTCFLFFVPMHQSMSQLNLTFNESPSVMTIMKSSSYLVLPVCLILSTQVHAFDVLGTGTGSLLGNDLTDLGNDGDENLYNPPADLGGFDAEFFSSDEPGFGGGEFAFNVFDNLLGPGNDKWCCGSQLPQIVGASLSEPYFLTHFTVSSANDVPDRDPRVWSIEGSNDGVDWSTIFSQTDPDASLWTERLQVLKFDAGTDFDPPDTAYSQFRLNVEATGLSAGAFFQVGEVEFFGEAVPEPSSACLAFLGLLGLFARMRQRRV